MTEGGKNIKPQFGLVRKSESEHYSHEAALVLECKGALSSNFDSPREAIASLHRSSTLPRRGLKNKIKLCAYHGLRIVILFSNFFPCLFSSRNSPPAATPV